MSKRKFFFVTFEGIEGSGKSYQSKKLFKKLTKLKLPVIYTREPGGTRNAEKIRRVLLDDYFHSNSKEKFDKYTDTLLYLAARNEHVINKLKPAFKKKKIVLCDRFIDSTAAYQIFGKKIKKNFVDNIHSHILDNIKPNLTFILKANISKAMKRLKKRKVKNRYDKFSVKFYNNVQRAFLKIAKTNKRKYIIVDNSLDTTKSEKIIYNNFIKLYNK